MAIPYLVRITLNMRSALPEDAVQNDFAVSALDNQDATTMVNQTVSAFQTFYNTLCAGVLGAGPNDSVEGHLMEVWDLTGKLNGTTPLGSRDASSTWDLTEQTFDPSLPSECAIVMSYRASYTGAEEESGDDRPRARRRGRIFIGPLATATLTETNGVVHVSNDAADLVTAAGSTLATSLEATSEGYALSIWSRADAILRPIELVWCDNAYDTQRRRGVARSYRSEVPI